jgi:hypothetical protein
MLHLEEGTIHAWLDGELSPDEAENAAGHAAGCEQCRARVAEARGLMAGATRIVSALDAGPAGVIPRAGSAPAARRGPWYRLALTPARMSIAATIIVAIGLTFTVRRGSEEHNSAVNRMVDSPINLPVTTAPIADSSASRASGGPAASAKKMSATASAKPKALAQSSPVASPPPSVGATAVQEQKTVPTDKPAVLDAAKQVGAAPARLEPAPAGAAPAAARADSARAKDEFSKVAADSIERASAAASARRRMLVAGNVNQLSEVVATGARDAKSPKSVVVISSCYRMELDTTVWRGFPATFALQGQPTALGDGAPRGGGGGGGAGAAGATGGAPRPANAVLAFPSPPVRADYAVHAVAPNGRIDSAVVGAGTVTGPDAITVRFSTAPPNKPMTVVLAPIAALARLVSSDRTDTVRVARTSCLP